MTVKEFFEKFEYTGSLKIIYENKTFDYINSSIAILDFGNFSVVMVKISNEGELLLKVTA